MLKIKKKKLQPRDHTFEVIIFLFVIHDNVLINRSTAVKKFYKWTNRNPSP